MKRLMKSWLVASIVAARAGRVWRCSGAGAGGVTLLVVGCRTGSSVRGMCRPTLKRRNPDINVTIEQPGGWFDYWTALQTALVGGNAPDVFTNHLSKYPEFANLGQIVDIQPLVERDGVDTTQLPRRAAALWTRGDARYGLPKDWDTVAVIYNKDMVEAAGIDPAVFDDVDVEPGRRRYLPGNRRSTDAGRQRQQRLEPGLRRENVAQFGCVSGQGGGYNGHEQWSHFAASTGWTFTDGPWAESYHYDDPRFIDTIQWYADLNLEHGFAPSFAEVGVPDGEHALFAAGEGALVFAGSWRINFFLTQPAFEVGFALPPIGPEGRKTMFNGLRRQHLRSARPPRRKPGSG